jgi:hypothetical protein
MPVGCSGTPLVRKLGINESTRLTVIAPPSDYEGILGALPPSARILSELTLDTSLVHVFVTRREDLEAHLSNLRLTLSSELAVWVSWPRKSAKFPTTVTEDVIRELALPLGNVDVKVCAVTEIWSGLKLVVRKQSRRKEFRQTFHPCRPLDTLITAHAEPRRVAQATTA